MADSDKIVLLKSFDLVVEAGLAKAKLDAHGIPCFLTNENNAYALPINPHFSTRLMVFKNDVALANEILNDQSENL